MAQEVEFASAGVSLSATISCPPGTGVVPGLVLVGGSGPADRHSGGFLDALRDHLVGAGTAVLAYDKRGAGRSTGAWSSATVDDLADDAAAAVAVLRSHPRVDAQRVAMLGHSEGGWVALRCCVRGVDVHRLILNSCPGVSFLEAERFALVAAGAGEESAARLYRDLVTAARADVPLERGTRVLASFRAEPWYEAALGGFELTGETWEQLRVWADYDPDDDLRRLRTPTLVVLGGADPLVPVRASVARYERSAEEARRPQRVVVLAGADHRLEVAETGFAHGYLRLLDEWCRATGERLSRPRPS
ncbi:alpha/beta hydrolase family protein [Nocardioides nematodiphilus]|uniref:alpha/beta hydrolase family protein n=1 Tax=Nocardioides nematodiphilus TaxID=2849669 RepID=UPI001CD9D2B7|nr:alpha/beta fold hydrolase [Nocardioides nematodiphilus]MCA1984663.1 alpha/beta hydrolase [Nocardioides nematodiphilus]